MDDLDDLGDKELIQSALRGDFELIAGYGEEHPGPGQERGSTTNRPCVSSPRSPAMPPGTTPRCAPGSGILTGSSWRAGSTRSVVCGGYERRSSATSSSEPRRPAAAILTSIGEGAGVICVALRADQETLASELADRYGSAVELRVGRSSSRPAGGAIRRGPPGRRWRSRPSTGSR